MNTILLTGTGDYTFNLVGYTPAARYGTDDPWTQVRVEESETSDGTWTEIATAALSPLDDDPAEPATWKITVAGATLLAGWYRAVWIDALGDQQPTEAAFNSPIRPSVADIGKLLHARTTVDGGSEAGTFNDDTDPTGDTVNGLIDVAVDQIAISLPDTLTAKQVAVARRMVGYLAAILVENAHFSDQVTSGDSLAAMYQGFLDAGMLTLTDSLEGDLPGGAHAFAITTPTDYQDTLEASGRAPWWASC